MFAAGDRNLIPVYGINNMMRPINSLTPQRYVMNRSFAVPSGKDIQFANSKMNKTDHINSLLHEREKEIEEHYGTKKKNPIVTKNTDSTISHLESLVYEKDLLIEKLTEDNEKLKANQFEFEKRISSLLSENQRLNSTCVRRLEEIERLMHKLKGQENYESIRETDENSDINELHRFSEADKDHDRRINLLKTENSILTKKLNQKNKEIEELVLEIEKNEALYHNMEISEERTRELLRKVEDYERKLEILLAENDKLNNILQDRFDQSEKIKQIEHDNILLMEDFQKAINQIAYLEGKTSESERINMNLSVERNRVFEVETKIEKLIDENGKLVELNESLRNELENGKSELFRLQKEKRKCEEAEERLIVMESDLEYMKEILKEKESSPKQNRVEQEIRGEYNLQYGQKIMMLGAEIERLYSIIEELSDEISALRSKPETRPQNNFVASLNEDYEDRINTEVKKIRNVQCKMEEECQEYEARLFSIQNERQVLLNEIEKWKKKFKVSEENAAALSEVEWNFRNTQNEVERLTFALNEKGKEVEYLSKKITEFERIVMRNVDYEKKIRDLAIENERLNSIIISRCRELIEYR